MGNRVVPLFHIHHRAGNSLGVSDGELRLLGNDSILNETDALGRLEISYHGVWMTLCGAFFSEAAAEVACRQLGYTTFVNVCNNSSWYVHVHVQCMCVC